MTEYCVCKHLKESHSGWENEPTGCDTVLVHPDLFETITCECTKFKLDNLRFIEDMARDKGLV